MSDDAPVSTSPDSASKPSPPMPRWLVPAAVVVALVALFWPRGERISLVPERQPVDLAGTRVAIASRLAPVTLVHFWATWCAPCVTEIPALQRLASDFSGERSFGLVLIAVADRPEAAQEFLGPRLAALNLFDGDWQVAKAWGTTKIPESYLVVDGKVVEKFEGAAEWDRSALRDRLRQALARAGGAASPAG